MTRKTKPAVSFEVVGIDQIIETTNNPRLHTPANKALIENSIKKHGAARSVVIDENNQLIAGNGTTDGARAAGVKQVIIVDVDGDQLVAVRRRNLDENAKHELAVIDNRANELSEWNYPNLQQFLRAVKADEQPENALGFTKEELHIFFNADYTPKDVPTGDNDHHQFTENLTTTVKFSFEEFGKIQKLARIHEQTEKALILLALEHFEKTYAKDEK